MASGTVPPSLTLVDVVSGTAELAELEPCVRIKAFLELGSCTDIWVQA